MSSASAPLPKPHRPDAEGRASDQGVAGRSPSAIGSRKMTRISWTPVLTHAADIVHTHETSVTLRQLFYRLVANQTLPNTPNYYRILSAYTAEARRRGAPPRPARQDQWHRGVPQLRWSRERQRLTVADIPGGPEHRPGVADIPGCRGGRNLDPA